MALTQEQMEARATSNKLGASDVAMLLGMVPGKTRTDLWLRKTKKVDEGDFDNEVMAIGRLLEPSILDYAEEQLGPLNRDPDYCERLAPGNIPLLAHLDAALVVSPVRVVERDGTIELPVEAKTSGIINLSRGVWGDSGTDQVPEHVYVQVVAQMIAMCKKADLSDAPPVGYVVALVAGIGRRLYRLTPDRTILTAIAETIVDFYEKNVLADMPPDSAPSYDMAKLIKRVDRKETLINDESVMAWDESRKARLAMEKEEKERLAVVLMELGDAEIGHTATCGTFEYIGTPTNRLDTTALKTARPEIYAAYLKESITRTARLKAVKVEKEKKAKR